MKKLILSLSFAFLAVIFAGFFGSTAHAQLESPVPLGEVMPTTANSALYGVPWSQSTDGFAFSYTIDFDRCACAGGHLNVAPKAIQQCMNKLGFNVSSSGPGSFGMETNCVGAKTVDAIDQFQKYFGFEEKAMNHFGDYTAYFGEVSQVLANHLCFGESGANDARSYEAGTTQSTVSSGGGSRSGGSRSSTTIIYQNGDDNGNGGGADAEITMTKRVVPANASEGDVVTFYFDLATNNGGSHTGITITDNLAGLGPITCGGVANGSVSMSGNSTLTCSASYTATSSSVTNNASVTSGDDSTPNTGSATLTVSGVGGGNDPTISMPNEPLAPALVNTEVQSTVSATGANGCTGIAYAILSTSPTNLNASIDAGTGVVTVNPSVAGDWNVVVRATCSDGTFNDGTISGEATETQPDPTIEMIGQDLGEDAAGAEVISDPIATTALNGCDPVTYSIQSQSPGGLGATIDPNTGAVTVTPTLPDSSWSVIVQGACSSGTPTTTATVEGTVAAELQVCNNEVTLEGVGSDDNIFANDADYLDLTENTYVSGAGGTGGTPAGTTGTITGIESRAWFVDSRPNVGNPAFPAAATATGVCEEDIEIRITAPNGQQIVSKPFVGCDLQGGVQFNLDAGEKATLNTAMAPFIGTPMSAGDTFTFETRYTDPNGNYTTNEDGYIMRYVGINVDYTYCAD